MFIPGKLEDRYYPRFFYALGINNLGLEIRYKNANRLDDLN